MSNFATTATAPSTPGEQSDRMVTATVRGQQIAVPCPAWCTEAHSEDYAFLEDVSHIGEEMALAAPAYSGGEDRTEQVLIASVSQWPFASDGRPFLSLDASGDSECAELDATQALAFADQLVAHAAEIRRMARMVRDGGRA